MYPQIFGKYVLERPIAVGGMARVFLATLRGASGFEKKLVVKQIRSELATDEAFVKRFVEEAKTTVELSHPNIVPVYELGVEQGVYYLAMELCDGLTLAELLAARGHLSPEETAYVGVEICRALDYAHRRAGVIHRDVTPRNVILDEEGAIRVIDFGIAARAYAGHKEIFGSPGHMPPEQINGGELGPTTDVFAAAALLYEAWTGVAPFRRKTLEESERALAILPEALSSFDLALAPLDELIASALSPEPSRRPKTAEELSRALRTFASGKDAGDLARQLGARVRAVRATKKSSVPPPALDDPKGPDTTRADGFTQTFAATRRLQDAVERSEPGDPEDLSADQGTRRLPEEPASWSTGKKPRGGERPSGSRWWARAGAVVLGTSAVGALALALESRSPAPRAAPSEPAPPAAPSAPPFITSNAPPPVELPPPPLSASVAVRTVPPPPTVASSLASGSAPSVPIETARARILATPTGIVEIDGKARGAAPIDDLPLAPGQHFVRLSCPALGETISQNVRVAPGDKITIVADFTGAPSRITVRTNP